MPFSFVLQGYPQNDVPVAHVQGPMVQAMFLSLIQQVDPALSQRLHDESSYRPYTLSPLGLVKENRDFQEYWLPRDQILQMGTPCYVRITFLDDGLFPTFNSYFLNRLEPTFRLGETAFAVTNILCGPDDSEGWGKYLSYAELIDGALRHNRRQIKLRFFTPTSFSAGRIDLPLPLPRLVFRSYKKRFEAFFQVAFLPDFEEQVEFHTGISNLKAVHTEIIRTKHVSLIGFTGTVTYEIHRDAPPELVFQMNLLADYAFFCGTGKKTTVGMGQTMRI